MAQRAGITGRKIADAPVSHYLTSALGCNPPMTHQTNGKEAFDRSREWMQAPEDPPFATEPSVAAVDCSGDNSEFDWTLRDDPQGQSMDPTQYIAVEDRLTVPEEEWP